MLAKTLLSLGALLGVATASVLPRQQFFNTAVGPRNPDEQLAFVFQLVRHGARAPIENRDLEKFSVGEGFLTPEGMRQRYLLGRHNRERYVQEYGFLSEKYNPMEIYIQSTNVNRTIQSGYSELMGLYPPGHNLSEKLTPAMQENLSNNVAMPRFTVRKATQINSELSDLPLPNGYVQVDIKEFNNHDINDDVSTDGCNYINSVGVLRENDPAIWAKYEWVNENTEGPIEKALDVDQAYIDSLETWHKYQIMTDTTVALDFEGEPEHSNYFSDDQWELTNELQKIWLSEDYNKDATDLMASRMLRKPLSSMQNAIDKVLGKSIPTNDALKFVIYSAHDTQVVNMMNFLKKDYDFTPYASTVVFEVKYSANCLAKGGQDECFGVSVSFNGEPLLFDGCSGDTFTLEGCSWSEFKAYIKKNWYSGASTADLDAACAQEPTE